MELVEKLPAIHFTLPQDHTSALLTAIGVTDGGKPNAAKRKGGRGGGRRATREARFSDEGSLCGQEAADAPGSLGAKLQELGRRLLQVRRELWLWLCAGVCRPHSPLDHSCGALHVLPHRTQDINETAGHHSAGERGLGMQRLNSAGARSTAAPHQQQQLRRGGPTGSRRER